ncbi:MAG: hypothetical protein U9R19_15745, partial [Bacteroidota bacterium]|nr:hypothetical protein [Bacteroidota bacterium]
MANTLFEFPSEESFPDNIVDFELNDIERVTLKMLAFINTPQYLHSLRILSANIVTSLPRYKFVKNDTIYKIINKFKKLNIIEVHSQKYSLTHLVSSQIIPLAGDNQDIIIAAYRIIEKEHNWGDNQSLDLLAILSGDGDLFNKTFFNSRYFYEIPMKRIWDTLLNLGSFDYIIPLLPKFQINDRLEFLYNVPFYLSYSFFEQWIDVLCYHEKKPNWDGLMSYLSCAHLVLPWQQVEELTERVGVDKSTLFFSELLKGNPEKALEMGAEYLVFIQDLEGHKRKEMPGVFGLLYAIVLMASGDGKNMALAATFARKTASMLPEIGEMYNSYKDFAQIVVLFSNHKLGKKLVEKYTFNEKWNSRYNVQFFTAAQHWVGYPLSDKFIPSGVSEKEEMEYLASGLGFQGES